VQIVVCIVEEKMMQIIHQVQIAAKEAVANLPLPKGEGIKEIAI